MLCARREQQLNTRVGWHFTVLHTLCQRAGTWPTDLPRAGWHFRFYCWFLHTLCVNRPDLASCDVVAHVVNSIWNLMTEDIYGFTVRFRTRSDISGIRSPLYNRNGWVGVKHQVTLLTSVSDAFPVIPSKRFQCWSDCMTMVRSRPFMAEHWLIDVRLYSAILRSLEQTHCARMWFLFYSAFFEYPPKWCAGMAGATWNCCRLGAFCVHHTTMHHVTSRKATYVRCTRV